jgi:predicted PurR-regulated permease PerM
MANHSLGAETFAEFKRRVFFVAVLVLVVLFIIRYPALPIQIFASILVASVLVGMTGWLSARLRMRTGLALFVVLIALLAILAALGFLIGVPFYYQLGELGKALASAYEALNQQMAKHPFLKEIAGELPAQAKWLQAVLSGPIWGIFSGFFGALTSIVLIFFISLYLAASPQLYFRGLLGLFPEKSRPLYEETFRILGRSLQYWMLGQALSMSVVGLMTGIGLWITGIPLVLSLAVISGLLAFVPVVGPIVSAVPGLLLGFSESMATGGVVLLVYFVVQTLESYLLTPLINKHVVRLPPVLLLVSQATFAALAGIPGLVFAAPLTLALVILIQQIYVRGELGHQIETIGKKPKQLV